MKVLSALCLVALVAVAQADFCFDDVTRSCAPTAPNQIPELSSCNAVYGAFGRLERELQAYANQHLERSYEYLLTSTFFKNYETNREGFAKLFRKLSDDTWAQSIDLIKHITMRGGKMDFTVKKHKPLQNVELHELKSLAKALDTQKELAERAFHIHREATRNKDDLHDAEIAQYLEEDFIEKHAPTIRNLAGHTTDLKHFIGESKNDVSLAFYLFDEYLTNKI